MKKVLNTIIIIASFLLLVLLALVKINEIVTIVDLSAYQNIVDFLLEYGAIIIVGALVFVNVIAKSLIRIIFLILFLLAFVVYILATSFPQVFSSLGI